MENDSRKSNTSYDILLLTAGFLVFIMFGLRTISGADIWLHLSAGRNAVFNGVATIDPFSFSLPPGTAWIQTTWLYDIMVYKLWLVGGSAIIVLLHAAAVAGGFLLMLPVCRKYSGQADQAIALLIASWLMAPLFTARPLVFCLVFIALFMNLLNRSRVSIATGVVLVIAQILWANMHTTFILGIGMALVRTWEAFSQKSKQTEEPQGSSPAHFAVLTALLAGVSLLNPFGTGLYKKALEAITNPDNGIILEWVSLFHRDFLPVSTGFITTLTLILIAAVFIFYRGRLPAVPTFCAILSAFLLVRSNLSVELCAVLAFPFMAISIATLTGLTANMKSVQTQKMISIGLRAACATAFAISAWTVMTNRYYINTGSASAFGLGVNTDAFPVGALKYIRENHQLPKRTLNIANDGGYILWQQPDEKVFTDPRGDLYGGLFFQRLAKGLLGNIRHWEDLIKRYDPEGILLNATWTGSGTVVYQLISRGDWVIAYFDGTSVLLVRKTASNRALMEDAELQKKGVELIDASYQRYKRNLENTIIRPPNPSRLIGASAVLQALGRHNESIVLLRALTKGTPRMATAWINLGISEVNLKRPEDAVRSLEHALDLIPANPITLLWLSEAYKEVGREGDAAMTLDKARRINAELATAFQKSREAMMFKAPQE